jgi:hypothetical protein
MLLRYKVCVYKLNLSEEVSSTVARGRVVNIPASYSGGPGFKFLTGDRLY